MGQRQFVLNSTQLIAILLDVIGLILNLIGAAIARGRPGSALSIGLYWVGFVLLVVALIAFVLSMRSVRASPSPPPP
jgi:uncharacterized membrane protein